MGVNLNQFHRKVELLQAFRRSDSETFVNFMARVTEAAGILKESVLSKDNQEWAKVMFVAGLQPPHDAFCMDLLDSSLEDIAVQLSETFPMDNKYIPVGDFLDKSASKVKDDDDDWDAWSDNQDVPMEDLSNEDSNVVEVKREATEEVFFDNQDDPLMGAFANGTLQCGFCLKNIDRHVIHKHVKECDPSRKKVEKEEGSFMCSICFRGYKRQEYLNRHVKNAHQGFHRDYHEQTIKKSDGKTEEKIDFSGEGPFKCKKCPKEYMRREGLQRHIKTRHEGMRVGEFKINRMKRLAEEQKKIREEYEKTRQKEMEEKEKLAIKTDATDLDDLPPHMKIEKLLEGNEKMLGNNENMMKKFLKKKKELRKTSLEPKEENLGESDNESEVQENMCDTCGAKGFKTQKGMKDHVRRLHARSKCEVCAEEFEGTDRLRKHEVEVHGLKKVAKNPKKEVKSDEEDYLCDLCPKTFRLKANLRMHKQSVHENIRPFKCDECGKSFTTRTALDSHRNTHTGARPYQCDQCAMGFTNSANLGRHQDRYHKSDDQKKVFICTDCGGFFTRKDTLKAHCLSIHGKPMTNFEVKTVAEVGMPSKNSSMPISSLPRERNQGVDTTKSPSADCGGRMMVQPGGKRIPMRVKMNNKSVETMISEGLIRYVDTGSEDALKTLPEDAVFRRNRPRTECQICGYTTFHPMGMAKHTTEEHNGFKYKCTKCGKLCKQVVNLELHMFRSHKIKPAKMFECAKCHPGEFLSVTKTEVINHLIRTHGETDGLRTSETNKKYSCDLCEAQGKIFRFPTITRLTKHIERHNKPLEERKTLHCDFCHLMFCTPAQVDNHVKIVHLKIKEARCTICNTLFGLKNNLDEHIAIKHMGFKDAKHWRRCKNNEEVERVRAHPAFEFMPYPKDQIEDLRQKLTDKVLSGH